jgi:hypothetical protein
MYTRQALNTTRDRFEKVQVWLWELRPAALACPAQHSTSARLHGRVQGVGWEFKRLRCECVEE